MNKYPIRLGYACINTDLRVDDIFTSRSLILRTAEKGGIDHIRKLIVDNVDDLFKILIYNEAHGIRFFRISSCLFPHLGNPKLADSNYNLDFVKDKLKKIGLYAKKHGHRLTMHPGQFIQLGSPNTDVVAQSIVDLNNHAKLLELLGYYPADGAVLIIHGGGVYGSKAEALDRWRQTYLNLPTNIRGYIALENDEFSYSVADLLPFCENLNMPFCLDIFHNNVSKDREPITKSLIGRIFNTWTRHGLIPKIHASEQQPDLKRGAHSKTLDKLPLYLFKLPIMFNTPFDIMLEVKDKEVSVFKLYYKYFDIKMDKTGKVTYIVKKKVYDKLGIQ